MERALEIVEKGARTVTPRPITAADVAAETDKTDAEQKAEASRRAVRAREAKREALRRNGADVGVASDTLAADLGARLKRRDVDIKRNSLARKAAAARLAMKGEQS